MTRVQCLKCGQIFVIEDESVCPECGNSTFQAIQARNSRVFILQKDRYNVISARDYGEIVWLFDKEPPLDLFNVKEAKTRIHEKLEKCGFNPQVDFIALTGPSSLLAIFFAVVMAKYPRVNTLIFDSSASRYRSRMVEAA